MAFSVKMPAFSSAQKCHKFGVTAETSGHFFRFSASIMLHEAQIFLHFRDGLDVEMKTVCHGKSWELPNYNRWELPSYNTLW